MPYSITCWASIHKEKNILHPKIVGFKEKEKIDA